MLYHFGIMGGIYWLVLLELVLLIMDNVPHVCGQEVCLFGSAPECYFPCHCGNETHPEPCDPVTGACNSGSCGYSGELQWSGPGCLEGDVAYGKTVYLASHLNETSVYSEITNFTAGTGSDMCDININTSTSYRETAWYIDIEDEYLIERVYIKYNYTSQAIDELYYNLCRKRGYLELSTYQANSTLQLCDDFPIRYLRYQRNIFHCFSTGRFIQLYLRCDKGAFVFFQLCDIMILGRPEVNMNCSNCLQNPESTPCGNGVWCEHCKPGWRPPDCQKACATGYYGVNCLHKCKHHCANVPCDPVSGVKLDDDTCASCDPWYIDPLNLCKTYVDRLDPYSNLIDEVTITVTHVLIGVSYDKRISKDLANSYKYHTEYSMNNFTEYTVINSQQHLESATYHFSVSLTNFLQSDDDIWLRVRLYREQDNVEDTGPDPPVVFIPGTCTHSFVSVVSEECQSLAATCTGTCKFSDDDEISILYRQYGQSDWLSAPLPHDVCRIDFLTLESGKYEFFVELLRHENGVLIKVNGEPLIVDIGSCQVSNIGGQIGGQNKDQSRGLSTTTIVMIVFLVLLLAAIAVLAVIICRKGKYYLCLQHMHKKDTSQNTATKDKGAAQQNPGQQYENVTFHNDNSKVEIQKANIGNTYEYSNAGFERSPSIDPKEVSLTVDSNEIYANSMAIANHGDDTKTGQNIYAELTAENRDRQGQSIYESMGKIEDFF